MLSLMLLITIFAIVISFAIRFIFYPVRLWQWRYHLSRRLFSHLIFFNTPSIRSNNSRPATRSGHLSVRVRRFTFGLAILSAIIGVVFVLPYLAFAEGSRNLITSGGNRPWLEDRPGTTAGVDRTNTIYVYANAGETINLGSSAVGLGSGDILFRSPLDASFSSCLNDARPVGSPADWGRIDDINEELAGPLPAVGGYVPCVINVTAATQGIWQIQFKSPGFNMIDNPLPTGALDNWIQPNNRFWIAAWDITVMQGTAPISGRVFANYLPFNMGDFNSQLDPEVFILTNDGYQYRVDLNGQQPFGFIFFSNNQGFIDSSTGQSLYRSVQLDRVTDAFLGTDTVHPPDAPDTATSFTHKIFFSQPNPDLPETAAINRNGQVESIWLLNVPVTPPVVTNFDFIGIDGTPRQAGTSGLGGFFIFDATGPGNARIVIDLNRDGIPGNGNDRVITARVIPGPNQVFWDSRDGNGVSVPPGPVPFNTFIRSGVGEVHFPFLDVENNSNGFVIERINGLDSPDYTVYFDDSLLNGSSTNPLVGTTSISGAHGFSSNFGDHKGIDTWAFRSGDFEFVQDVVTIAEADLQIQKFGPATVRPGDPINYTIVVTNAGPSDARRATVQDILPPQITNATWTCAIVSGTGLCGPPSNGSGDINATVSLSATAVANFTVTGQVLPNTAGLLPNTVSVSRGLDATDPITQNNTFTQTTSILAPALDLTKSAGTPVDNGNGTFTIPFALVVENTGTEPLANLQITDNLADTFATAIAFSVSSGPSSSSLTVNPGYNGVGDIQVLMGVDTLAIGQVATVTFEVLVTPNGPSAYDNSAMATGTAPDGVPVTDESTARVGVGPLISLSKSFLPALGPGQTLEPGDPITYVLSYVNEGSTSSSGVVITDDIPFNTTYVPGSATPGPGSVSFFDENGVLQATEPASVTGLYWDIGTVPADNIPRQVSFVVRINTSLINPATGMAVQYSPEGWIVLEDITAGESTTTSTEPLEEAEIPTPEPNPTPEPVLTTTVTPSPIPTNVVTTTPEIAITVTPAAGEPASTPTITATDTPAPATTVEPTAESTSTATATVSATDQITTQEDEDVSSPRAEPTSEPTAEPATAPTAEPAPAVEEDSTAGIGIRPPSLLVSVSGMAMSILNRTILPLPLSLQAEITPTDTSILTASATLDPTVPAFAPDVVTTSEPATIEPPLPAVTATVQEPLVTSTADVASSAEIEIVEIIPLEELLINIDNVATIMSNNIGPTPSNMTRTPVLRIVDPVLTKEISVQQAVAGDPVDFNITMGNPSPSNAPATHVILTDPIPGFLELLSYDFSSAPAGLVTGDRVITDPIQIGGIDTLRYTVVLTIPRLAPTEQIFLEINTRVKDFVQGPLQIRNEAVMVFAEGAPKTDARTLNVPPPPSPRSRNDNDDSDDDDDSAPPPPPPALPAAAPAAAPVQPAPTLPVLFLPETGTRENQTKGENTVWGDIAPWLLALIGVSSVMVWRRQLSRKKMNSQ